MLWGGERFYRDGAVAGFTTSGAYGHTVGASVALGYVDADEPVTADYLASGSFEVDVAGERVAATASLGPLFDPRAGEDPALTCSGSTASRRPPSPTCRCVARLAAARFGFSEAAAFHQFTLTENWTYRIDEPGREPIVLRVYRPGGRPEVEVQSELAWMRALRADLGPIVPEVVATLDGGHIVEVHPAPAVPRCYCVGFSLAPGEEPPEDALAPWFPRLGAITARFHAHARAWQPPSWFSRPTWDLETTLGEHPHWGPWHSSVPDPEERAQIERARDTVYGAARAVRDGPARFGLVHADLRLANLIADGDDIQVIDFDDCGLSWYLYDLACALTFLEGRPDVDELIDLWVTGYRTVEPMSADGRGGDPDAS